MDHLRKLYYSWFMSIIRYAKAMSNKLTSALNQDEETLSLLNQISIENDSIKADDHQVIYDEPLIKFVDKILQQAIEQSISDIHIEPYENQCRIRFRRDGILYEKNTIPIELALRFSTRLKVMARLDISERRIPQDGRFHFNNINIRINSCPTLFGEKIVLRLLNSQNISLDLQGLGFSYSQYELFIQHITKPQGLILVTGPTGCGKTVTLYSALKHLNTPEKNISSVEDPVEIQLTGINQVSIQPKIGLDFAAILRTLLRQDPDIIMLGEIRDKETAEIAIQAAHTGHLVISTLHTNNSIEAIARLTSMGIPTYQIASSISLIIAQRLIRKLCNHCKETDVCKINSQFHPVFKPSRCSKCLNGYYERTGIYEFLPINEKMTELILLESNSLLIKEQMERDGHHLLRQNGMGLVLAGITSLSELNRVLQ